MERVLVGKAEREMQAGRRRSRDLAPREVSVLFRLAFVVFLADHQIQQGSFIHVEIGVHLRLDLHEVGQNGVVGDDVVVEIDVEAADAAVEVRLDMAVIDVDLGGFLSGLGDVQRRQRLLVRPHPA